MSGAAGHLARALLPRLCGDPLVSGVVGIDRDLARFAHPKFCAVRADLADAAALAAARNADALVHLAFVVLRGRTPPAEMRRINVDGGAALVKAARGRVVAISSAGVYGPGAGLAEDAPFAPLPGFLYAQHKAAFERLLERMRPDAAVLRPHMIFGSNALPLLMRLARLPLYARLPDPQPLLQAAHEDDVAEAIVRALQSDARGAFNIAHPAPFCWRDLVRRRSPRAAPVPLALLRHGLAIAWRLTGWGGEPAWIEGAARTLTIDCSRAERVLGWRAVRDPLEAV